MVKMKIHKFFTTVIYIYTFKVSNTYNRIVHEYKCLFLAFILFQIERESGNKIWGVTEKCPKVTYLIFLTGFHWRISLLSRANRLCTVFNAGLKDFGVLRVSVFLSLARSKMAIVRLPRALLKNYLFCALLPLRGREPHFRLGPPPPIIWLLFSFPFRCPATQGHLSANICVTHILS